MKFVVLGRYTEQGLSGFVKNPSDDRQEAAKAVVVWLSMVMRTSICPFSTSNALMVYVR